MRLIVATVALLFAFLPPPAGAQTKAKSKTSATKLAEESRKEAETAESKKIGGSAKVSPESGASKSKENGGATAAKKPSSSTASTKKRSEGAAPKKGAGGTATKEDSEGTASQKGSEDAEPTATKKNTSGSSKKNAGASTAASEKGDGDSKKNAKPTEAGAKKSSTGKAATKTPATGDDSETSAPAKKRATTTERNSDQGYASPSETKASSIGPKSTSKNGKSGSAMNGAPKKQIDKPPQDNAGEEPTRNSPVTGANITLDPDDLANFNANSKAVQRLLTLGLQLTRQGLTYRYGSSDPTSGGMDCSGTIYYLLKAAGVKEPPRDSSGLYLWAQKEGTLRQVNPTSLDDPALADLRPGDLMFWEGTYEVQRDPPISHTMIYLGKERATGMPVMIGASDGRTYGGVRRNGVSVFDFKLPRADSAARFVAYGRVPGIERLGNGKGK